MFLTRSEYDRGVNTFSPEGRLFQVEYAIEAIKLGSTAIGICTSEGVVLAVEKRITSPLMEPTTIEKIVEVDKHIGCAVSGLMADSRTMIDRARVEAQNHWFTYNEQMTVESCAQAVSNLAIQFGDSDDDGSAMSRPFGVAILFAGKFSMNSFHFKFYVLLVFKSDENFIHIYLFTLKNSILNEWFVSILCEKKYN